MIAAVACCGHTPFPIALSCWARVSPISGLVTHPGGRPIIHSANAALRRGLPLLLGSVGLGAATPKTRSQRRTAGAYFPHSTLRFPAHNRPTDGCAPLVCSGVDPLRSRPMRSVSEGGPLPCSGPLGAALHSAASPPRCSRAPCLPSLRSGSVVAARAQTGVVTSGGLAKGCCVP